MLREPERSASRDPHRSVASAGKRVGRTWATRSKRVQRTTGGVPISSGPLTNPTSSPFRSANRASLCFSRRRHQRTGPARILSPRQPGTESVPAIQVRRRSAKQLVRRSPTRPFSALAGECGSGYPHDLRTPRFADMRRGERRPMIAGAGDDSCSKTEWNEPSLTIDPVRAVRRETRSRPEVTARDSSSSSSSAIDFDHALEHGRLDESARVDEPQVEEHLESKHPDTEPRD